MSERAALDQWRVWANWLVCFSHGDKTIYSADACKNVASFEIIVLAVYGSPLLVLTKSKETYFWSNLVGFYNKCKIVTILFLVNYEKITLIDKFLVLLGPIINRFFACWNEEKRVLALILSVWFFCMHFQPGWTFEGKARCGAPKAVPRE